MLSGGPILIYNLRQLEKLAILAMGLFCILGEQILLVPGQGNVRHETKLSS